MTADLHREFPCSMCGWCLGEWELWLTSSKIHSRVDVPLAGGCLSSPLTHSQLRNSSCSCFKGPVSPAPCLWVRRSHHCLVKLSSSEERGGWAVHLKCRGDTGSSYRPMKAAWGEISPGSLPALGQWLNGLPGFESRCWKPALGLSSCSHKAPLLAFPVSRCFP